MLVAAGAVALGWTLSWVDPRRVLEAALGAQPGWLAASLALTVLRFAIWGRKWQLMLHRHGPVPFRLAMSGLMAGTFVNVTTPTAKIAGGLLRAVILHRALGWRRLTGYGWVLADQLSNASGTLAFASIAAVVVGLLDPSGPLARPLTAFGVAGIAALAAVLALRAPAWRWLGRPAFEQRLGRLVPRRLRERHEGHAGWVSRVFSPMLGPGPAALRPLPDIGLSALSFGALCMSNAVALRAVGADLPLGTVAVTVAVGYFAGMGVGGWGGLGVTEAALTALYVQAGVGPETAAAGVLLHRVGYFGTVLGWGGAALVQHGRAGSGNGGDDQRENSDGPVADRRLPSERPPGL